MISLPQKPDIKIFVKLYSIDNGGIKNELSAGWGSFILSVNNYNFESRLYFCDLTTVKAGDEFNSDVFFLDPKSALPYFPLKKTFYLTIPRIIGEGRVIQIY